MAGKSAILTVKILSDASQAGKGIDQASTKVGKFQSRVDKMVAPAALVGATVVAFGKKAADAASAVEQAYGGLDSVFGRNADQMKAWADTAAQTVGLSKAQYGDLATVIGAQLNNLTGDADTAVKGTQGLITLGADLAATFGGTTTEAVEALSSALKGEADPAEKYGLTLNQTAINAELAAQGLDKLTGDELKAAKANAVLTLATKQAGGAVGKFAEEADSAAGSSQIAAAQWENAQAALGKALLPALTAVTRMLGSMAEWMGRNSTLVLVLAGVLGTLAAAVLTTSLVLRNWQAIVKIATAVQWAWNAAMSANPIALVIIAVVALVAAVVLLWKKNEGFRNFVTAAWRQIASAASAAWRAIKAAAGAVLSWLRSTMSSTGAAAKAVWSAIKAAAAVAWHGIKSIVQVVLAAVRAYLNVYKAAVLAVWRVVESAATGAWNGVKAAAQTALRAISGPMNTLKGAIDAVIDAVRTLIDWLKRIKVPKISLPKIPGIGGNAAATTASAAPTFRGVVGAGPRAGGAAGVTVVYNINVSGTLNDVDAARALRRVLREDGRRRGGVRLGVLPVGTAP